MTGKKKHGVASNTAKRDPRAKFVELANMRVARAIKDIRLVGNLSNRRNYRFSGTEAKQIIRALEAELEDLKIRFRNKPHVPQQLFQI